MSRPKPTAAQMFAHTAIEARWPATLYHPGIIAKLPHTAAALATLYNHITGFYGLAPHVIGDYVAADLQNIEFHLVYPALLNTAYGLTQTIESSTGAIYILHSQARARVFMMHGLEHLPQEIQPWPHFNKILHRFLQTEQQIVGGWVAEAAASVTQEQALEEFLNHEKFQSLSPAGAVLTL